MHLWGVTCSTKGTNVEVLAINFQELQPEGGNVWLTNQIAAVVKICLASTSQCLPQ